MKMALRRAVGKAPKKAKGLSLEELSEKLEERCQKVDGSIQGINKNLREQKLKLNKIANKKSPSAQSIRNRCHMLLKQRKVYEDNLSRLQNQKFNVDQQIFGLQNAEFSKQQVETMKQTRNELKKFAVDPEDTYDLKTEKEMLGEDLDEVNRVLGEGNFNSVDDYDLEAELDALGMEDDFAEFEAKEKNKTSAQKDQEIDLELELLDELMDSDLPAAPKDVKKKRANRNKENPEAA